MIVEGLKSRRFVGFVVGSFDFCITSLSVRGRKEKKEKKLLDGWEIGLPEGLVVDVLGGCYMQH